MAEWGRKEYSKKWPSRSPVWAYGAILLTVLFFAVAFTVEYMEGWTAAQKLYLADYMKSGARGQASPTASAKYTLLEGVAGKGQRLLIDDEIEPVTGPDGRRGYRLREPAENRRLREKLSKEAYPRSKRTLLTGNHMSLNRLACLRPPAVVRATHRHGAAIPRKSLSGGAR